MAERDDDDIGRQGRDERLRGDRQAARGFDEDSPGRSRHRQNTGSAYWDRDRQEAGYRGEDRELDALSRGMNAPVAYRQDERRFERQSDVGLHGEPGHGRPGIYGRPDRNRAESRRGRGPRNYRRSDERIREDVCERLTEDDYVDASQIEVQVREGTVVLTGSVDERWEKHRAEDIADACSGVREVENRIRVAPRGGAGAGATPNAMGDGNPPGMGAADSRADRGEIGNSG